MFMSTCIYVYTYTDKCCIHRSRYVHMLRTAVQYKKIHLLLCIVQNHSFYPHLSLHESMVQINIGCIDLADAVSACIIDQALHIGSTELTLGFTEYLVIAIAACEHICMLGMLWLDM